MIPLTPGGQTIDTERLIAQALGQWRKHWAKGDITRLLGACPGNFPLGVSTDT